MTTIHVTTLLSLLADHHAIRLRMGVMSLPEPPHERVDLDAVYAQSELHDRTVVALRDADAAEDMPRGHVGLLAEWVARTEELRAALVEKDVQIKRLTAENVNLKISVIVFCAPTAVVQARESGRPDGELHPVDYDILAKAGARMDSFTRGPDIRALAPAAPAAPQTEGE